MDFETFYILNVSQDYLEGVTLRCTEDALSGAILHAMDKDLNAEVEDLLVFKEADGRKVQHKLELVK
jgi:hypothetical protein